MFFNLINIIMVFPSFPVRLDNSAGWHWQSAPQASRWLFLCSAAVAGFVWPFAEGSRQRGRREALADGRGLAAVGMDVFVHTALGFGGECWLPGTAAANEFPLVASVCS